MISVGGLVALSLALGVVLLLLRQRMAKPGRLALMAALVLTLLSVILLFAGQVDTGQGLVWIPGLDPISLMWSSPASYLVVLIFVVLSLSFWLAARKSPEALSGAVAGIALVGTALAIAALTVDQFLARLVALDLIGLLTAIALLRSDLPAERPKQFLKRYLTFKLGDEALLLMVLWLGNVTGSFRIDVMLASAPWASATGTAMGFVGLLAAWVKLGLPPFSFWVAEGLRSKLPERHLIVNGGLPLLGAYLLYRMQPAFAASGSLGVLRLLAFLAAMAVALSVLRRRHAPAAWCTLHSALALALVGTGAFRWYLIAFVPVRLGLSLWASARAPVMAPADAGMVDIWMDKGARAVAAFFMGLPAWLDRWLEQGLVMGFLRWLAEHTHRTASLLSQHHTGRLRRNLLWTTAALLVLVALGGVLWHP